METIKVVKLTTGEEILGSIEENEDGIVISNPVRIAVMPGKNGQPNIGFAPWPIHAEQEKESEFPIAKKHVVYTYTPAEEYVNNYNQIFGSGIVLPPTKQLITG